MTAKSLLKEARKLNLHDRSALAQQLWASVEGECEPMPLSSDLKAKLDQRLDERRKNPQAGYTLAETRRMLKRLKSKK